MCEPTTLAIASMAIGAAGTLYSAQAASNEADYNAKVQRNNAIVSENQAKDAEARGRQEEANHRLKVAQMKSSQRARLGASGADVNLGSAGELQQDTAMMGELDALTIRSNYDREAYQFREQGRGQKAQAGLTKARGRNTSTATLIGGASNVAGQWYNFSQG